MKPIARDIRQVILTRALAPFGHNSPDAASLGAPIFGRR